MRVPYSMNKGNRKGPPPGLINALFLACVYGYFAMHVTNDPLDCYANDSSDNAIDEGDTEGMKSATNIGGIFQLSFQVLFFMTIIEVVISLFAYTLSSNMNSQANAEPVYQLAIFFYAMASLMEVILWIYLFFTRFSHPGQVCSGDFISRNKADNQYCRVQGLFIKAVALLVVASCCCIIFLVPYLSNRKRKRALRAQASIEHF